MSIPATMNALVVEANKTAVVKQIPVPELGENEVLIKNSAVALNPTDWKHVQFLTTPGAITGCDFAGTVVKVGINLQHSVSVGDKVAGCVRGGTFQDRGAFAEYLKTYSDQLWKIPDNTFSFEEAATTGIGLWTAVQALYHPTRLGLIQPPKPTGNEWVFVYAGSTSVGQFAIQLAHLSGYKVATVGSPKNHEYLKSIGADFVADYKDPEAIAKIRKASGGTITKALDTYSEQGSQSFSVKVLDESKPGKLVIILGVEEEAKNLRQDVTIRPTIIYSAMVNDTPGHPLPSNPSEEDRIQVSTFLRETLSTLVIQHNLKSNKVKLESGGLQGIVNGLEYLKEGKASAEKLVYTLA